ncbi:MAG: vitamin K epoxide reductase family protein, partial [Prolixibacteraceae bacterium]|nr:vitamin K epoxide reductase family protein [Prolixibacteraceae bacterium]
MNMEDNAVFVLQKAVQQLKIEVNKESIKEDLLSNPYYPSLKSICDTLKKYNVEYYPLRLTIEEIKELEMAFIAHSDQGGGRLVFVKEIKNNKVTFFVSEEKIETRDFEDFSKLLSGAVVLMQAKEDSGEHGYKTKRQNEIINKSLLPLGIVSIITWIIFNLSSISNILGFQPGYIFGGLIATKITGLVASVFLVLHELKVHTPIVDKICRFNSKTDCDTVLNSNASKLFGWINWADAGLIYFTGTLLFLSTATESYSLWILSLISAMALPYPVFSIYYQAVKTKKWCPFCLLVQLVLIAEFILLFPLIKTVSISVTNLLTITVSFLVPASLWFIFKSRFTNLQQYEKIKYSYLSFKRNPQIFKSLLQNNEFIEIAPTRNSLILGNPEASITITAFLSLHCGPCKNAFIQFENLLENCQDVNVNAIFSVHDDEQSKKLINSIYYIYQTKGQSDTLNFLFKWYNTPKAERKELYEKDIPSGFDISKQIKQENQEMFEENK